MFCLIYVIYSLYMSVEYYLWIGGIQVSKRFHKLFHDLYPEPVLLRRWLRHPRVPGPHRWAGAKSQLCPGVTQGWKSAGNQLETILKPRVHPDVVARRYIFHHTEFIMSHLYQDVPGCTHDVPSWMVCYPARCRFSSDQLRVVFWILFQVPSHSLSLRTGAPAVLWHSSLQRCFHRCFANKMQKQNDRFESISWLVFLYFSSCLPNSLYLSTFIWEQSALHVLLSGRVLLSGWRLGCNTTGRIHPLQTHEGTRRVG